jgi:hypothetical protein
MVGMTFKDVDDAYKFYKRYAYEVGFSTEEIQRENIQ